MLQYFDKVAARLGDAQGKVQRWERYVVDALQMLQRPPGDLWTGVTRGWGEELFAKGRVDLKLPWATQREMPLLSLLLGEQQLRKRYQAILDGMHQLIAVSSVHGEPEAP